MNCPNCGASLSPDSTRCVKCGSHVQPAAQPVYQQVAGQQTAAPPAPPVQQQQQTPYQMPYQQQQPMAMDAPRSKLAAALLAIFLGWFGVHNFYLGHIARGVIQLVLTLLSPVLLCLTLPIVGIWVFIEFILILTGSLRDKYNRPLA